MVARVNVRVEHVEYVHITVAHQVSLVPVPLVRIQVYYQHSLYPMILPRTVQHYTDVWVYTETTTTRSSRVVVSARKVDGPATSERHAGSIHRALSCPRHGFQHPHPQQEGRYKEQGHLETPTDKE